MRESLLQKRQQPKSYKVRDGFLLFTAIAVLVLVSVAFYVALKQYLDDRAITVNTVINCAVDNTQRAFSIQDEIAQDKASLDAQTAECEAVFNRIADNRFQPEFIDVYRQLNDTIHAANATCNAELERMSTLLMQLINGINATADVVGTGTCQFTTPLVTNVTLPIQTVTYEYKRLLLNDLEYYYYVFGANSGPALLVEDAGAAIENCSPIIFNSRSVQSKTVVSNNKLVPLTYARELLVGQNKLELKPASGAMHTNQTLSIEAGFQVFLNIF